MGREVLVFADKIIDASVDRGSSNRNVTLITDQVVMLGYLLGRGVRDQLVICLGEKLLKALKMLCWKTFA